MFGEHINLSGVVGNETSDDPVQARSHLSGGGVNRKVLVFGFEAHDKCDLTATAQARRRPSASDQIRPTHRRCLERVVRLSPSHVVSSTPSQSTHNRNHLPRLIPATITPM